MLRRRTRHGHPYRARLAAAATVLALVVAGCGGEDEDEFAPGVSQPQTKVDFLGEADSICLSAEQQIEAAADDLLSERGGLDPAEVERVALRIAVPALETEVRAIAAIPPPDGDEAEIEAILAATEQGITEIEADPRRLADGPPPGLQKAQRLAESYGSQQCGFSG